MPKSQGTTFLWREVGTARELGVAKEVVGVARLLLVGVAMVGMSRGQTTRLVGVAMVVMGVAMAVMGVAMVGMQKATEWRTENFELWVVGTHS